MGFKTPLFGPFAGQLCRDGVPVAELPEGYQPPLPVAVPDFVPSDAEARYRRGIEGAALEVHQEHQRLNTGIPYEQSKARVVAARRLTSRRQER
jgi:hypothetical protein